MGTSSSGGGAGNGNPLIPSWIPAGDPATPLPDKPKDDIQKTDNPDSKATPLSRPNILNRYTAPRKDFNKFISGRGSKSNALRRALKTYSRNAAGTTTGMAKRMAPSVSRVSRFVTTIDVIRQAGLNQALSQFNLSEYINRPLLDILSALCDEVFKDTGKLFENTQDDSVTKEAYANTVVRVCEIENIELNNLTNEHVEVMIATFIEETIAQRVIMDIGNKMAKLEPDPSKLVEIENTVYQIVNGLVRNQIMPEVIASQRGERQNLEKNIENVYRVAFDVMSNINEV